MVLQIITDADHGLSNGDDFKMRELIFSCDVGGATGYGQTFTITQFQYDNVTGCLQLLLLILLLAL